MDVLGAVMGLFASDVPNAQTMVTFFNFLHIEFSGGHSLINIHL